ncbi:MAG TPA: M48 family metallopeptidase [Actinocrinis sp.]|nr:M48 family metallopeptidase [Actinocrinis sp.]
MGEITFTRPLSEFLCPQCGWTGDFEARFPAWCLSCTYGAEGGMVLKQFTGRAQRQKSAASRRSEKLYAKVVAAPQLRPTGLLRRTTIGVALLIHLVTLLVLAGGIVLIATMPPASLAWFFGPLLILLAITLRPRFPAMEHGPQLITREQAPELFGLLDEIAALLHTHSFTAVRLSITANAGTAVFGLRRRERLLDVGVPLWQLLGPQERVALLAHEVAHGANADSEYGLVVASALSTLRRWYAVTHPLTLVTGRTRLKTRNVVDVILPFHVFHRWASALVLRSTPRAEYLADRLAAQVASTDAVHAMLDRMVTAGAAMQVLLTAVRARVPSQPWRIVRDFAAALPEHEQARLALLSARAGVSIDDSHPPTHLRLQLLRGGEPLPAQLTMTGERCALIDAELADPIEQLGAKLSKFARR